MEHQRLVNFVAWRWWKVIKTMNTGMEFEDVQQEAYIALLNASKGFKPELGLKFSTYFVTAARNHFLALINRQLNRTLHTVELDAIDGSLIDAIPDESNNPESRLIGERELSRRVHGLSPMGELLARMAINPPECLQREFEGVNAKRMLARDMRIDERHPAEINLTFAAGLLQRMGVSLTLIAEARREVRALEVDGV